MAAYQDCLEPTSSYPAFRLWFQAVSYEAQRQASLGQEAPSLPERYLAAVRAATDHVLAPVGWHSLAWDFLGEQIVARHRDAGELPVSLLSDGVRTMIALVADLAHRAARLNPHLGADAPAQTAGIVLIDEIDLHLHPGWQQTIIGGLRAAFPQVQFIVTTHSPQVLSTVPHTCIRILTQEGPDFVVRTPALQTEGVPAPDVMASVMGTDPQPQVPIRGDLDHYRALIQEGQHDTPEGQQLRDRLLEHFGERHPEVLDLDRLIRFRRALAQGPSGKSP